MVVRLVASTNLVETIAMEVEALDGRVVEQRLGQHCTTTRADSIAAENQVLDRTLGMLEQVGQHEDG